MNHVNIKNESEIKAAFQCGVDATTIENRTKIIDDIPVAVIGPKQRITVLDDVITLKENRAEKPRRRQGTATHRELASFIAHVNRFKSEHSTIWANIDRMRVTAVLNYHPADDVAWCDHRSTYQCPRSEPWKVWSKKEGTWFRQASFADWVEERFDDITSGTKEEGFPAPLDLLAMARNLQIFTQGTFKRKIDQTTGERELVCTQEHSENSTKIPQAFLLQLPVFEAGTVYRIEARIRFRLRDGVAEFSYRLHRRTEIERDAFGDVRDQIGKETNLPLFAGAPENSAYAANDDVDRDDIPF